MKKLFYYLLLGTMVLTTSEAMATGGGDKPAKSNVAKKKTLNETLAESKLKAGTHTKKAKPDAKKLHATSSNAKKAPMMSSRQQVVKPAVEKKLIKSDFVPKTYTKEELAKLKSAKKK